MEHPEPIEHGQKFGIVGKNVARAAHQCFGYRTPVVALMHRVLKQRLRHGVNVADLTTFILGNIQVHDLLPPLMPERSLTVIMAGQGG